MALRRPRSCYVTWPIGEGATVRVNGALALANARLAAAIATELATVGDAERA